MGCIIVVLALSFPRAFLLFSWVMSNWPDQAFEGWFWPLLGFIFMPYTTIVYMGVVIINNGNISAFWFGLTIVAVIVDIISDIAAFSD